MKYSLILILACAPLAGLTAWSALGLLRQQVVPPEVHSVDFHEASNLAEQAKNRADGDEGAAQQWGQLELFDSRLHELTAAKSEAASQVIEAWRRAQGTGDLVVKIGEAVAASAGATNDPLRKVAEQLKTLEALVVQQRSEAAAEVEGADRIFQVLDRYIEQLKREKGNLEAREKIKQALQLATDRLGARKPELDEECLLLLDAEPLKSALDPEFRALISKLRETAQYRLAWRKLHAHTEHVSSNQELLEAYDGFLRAHPKHPSDVEKRAHDLVLAERAKLHVEVALEELERSPDLETLLARAEALTQQGSVSQDVKPRARTQVTNWLLTKGFPEKDPPDCLLGKDEAVTKNGRRLIGYFHLPERVDQWRYWKSSKTRETNPRGDEQIAQSDFAESPSKPKYMELAREYNERREKLVRDRASKEEWQAFARRCEDMQKELINYRDHWGKGEEADTACRDWTFELPAGVARQLIDRWTRYRAIFEK